MGRGFPSEHLSDADLLERLLGREDDAHVATCARCAARAETIARAVEPRSAEDATRFDAVFYARQAAAIQTRIAARDGILHSPRLGWAAIAAAVVAAVALRGPAFIGRRPGAGGTHPAVTALDHARRVQDRADERLLREVDDTLDADPYDVDLGDG